MHLKPGETFRHFRVLEKVGEGGMGTVYRARDTRLEREVALKFLTRVGRSDSRRMSRMLREARSLAALNHSSIVTIYDIDDAEGFPFLVLEWVGGGALSDPSFRRPLPVSEFLGISRSVAEALGEAHDRGIVHRDIKPGNVLLTGDGRAKLADFGLAKFRDSDRDLTETRGAVGTIAYMSPEQVNGVEPGPFSDVFSFGVLAYELLTGRRPFAGAGPGAVLSAIASDRRAPLSDLRQDIPDALTAIVEHCLENDPRSRFQNGRELALALRRFAETGESPSEGETSSAGAEVPGSGEPPRRGESSLEQDIRFCTTADGVRLAYSVLGSGPLLVRVLGWFTHLEMEWEWPDLRLLWERLAERFTVVRYDGRGIGLSDPYEGDFTEESRQLDLDAVLTAVGGEEAALLGISEGGWTAASYSVRHPDRVSHLILYGAYSRGARVRPGYDPEEERALATLIRKGWGRDTPALGQLLASQFFHSDADPDLFAHFTRMQRASADPETAARYYESNHGRGDGRQLFEQVKTPTLVIHCRNDLSVPAEEGRLLASIVSGARLVLLPSETHYFPTDREVVARVVGAIVQFCHGSE
jgi:pimeloyl-ACP methyl ester carboxylesterase